ncbi:Ras- protein Rab-24, partial [Dispira parvispora]
MNRPELNIALIGLPRIGKSTLIHRYINRDISTATSKLESRDTTLVALGINLFAKVIDNGPLQLVLRIWDVDGTSPHCNKIRLNQNTAFAAILCYDTNDHATMYPIPAWIAEIRHVAPHCRLYLCGLREDLYTSLATVESPLTSPTSPYSDHTVDDPSSYHTKLRLHHRHGYVDAIQGFCQQLSLEGAFETSALRNVNVYQLFDTIV